MSQAEEVEDIEKEVSEWVESHGQAQEYEEGTAKGDAAAGDDKEIVDVDEDNEKPRKEIASRSDM